MNFNHYAVASTLEGRSQVIPQGPVAALEIIKNLGTNGGGFFNANGAHPYENPTPLTNFLELLSIVLLPAGLTNTFGRMVQQVRQGWLLKPWVMLLLFVGGLIALHLSERRVNPHLHGIESRSSWLQSDGNMEGKEVRFGIGGTALAGVVNSKHRDGLRECGGRQFYLAWGVGVVNQSSTRGGDFWRSRHRYLQHDYDRCHRRVSRRAHDWTHPGISRQAYWAERKQDDCALRAYRAGDNPDSDCYCHLNESRTGRATTNTGPHGLTEILFGFASSFANNGQAFAGLNANRFVL